LKRCNTKLEGCAVFAMRLFDNKKANGLKLNSKTVGEIYKKWKF
jgi:hypothetical protein